ncbi:hypothetical protein ACS0PU_010300 [Formica fusca]
MHSARHRDCRSALCSSCLVSLIYCCGIPSEPDKRINGPTKGVSPQVSRAPRHLACTYSNPSLRPFVIRCGRRGAGDYLATLIELKITGRIPRSLLDHRDCALFTGSN